MGHVDRRLLHVDDDPQFTRMVKHRLAAHGFEVDALHVPEETQDYLLRGDHRLVLLDIDMPGMNGLDLLRTIKRNDGGVQVVLLTGICTTTTVLTGLRWGAEACFFKPLGDVEPLVDCLNDVVHKMERWWTSLHELTNRTKAESQGLPLPSANH